jgi:hypothetical protein
MLTYRGKETIGRIKIGIAPITVSKIILTLPFDVKKTFQNRRHKKRSIVSLFGPIVPINKYGFATMDSLA